MTKWIPTLLTTFLFPTTAEALSCAEGVYNYVPTDGLSDLPINSIPIVWSAYMPLTDDDLVLVNASTQEEQDITVTQIEGDAYSVVPNDGFESGVTYTLSQESWLFSTFTIGEQLDEENPSTPVITGFQRDRGSSEWGSWHYLQVAVDGPTDAAYYKIEVADKILSFP